MHTYLSRIQLEDYRSCRRTAVELRPDLSTLIGTNGSGKTNFLNGLLLLKKMARVPQRPWERHEESLQSTCKLKATFVLDRKRLLLEAVVRFSTTENNVDDVVSARQRWNFREFTGQDRFVAYPLSMYRELRGALPYAKYVEKRGARHAAQFRRYMEVRYGLKIGVQDRTSARELSAMSRVLERVQSFVAGTDYYSASQFTDPSRCPPYLEIEDDRMLRRSVSRIRNDHLQFIYDLYRSYKNPQSKYEQFLSLVGQQGAGLIDTIEYSEVPVSANVYKVTIGGKVVTRQLDKLLVVPNFLIGNAKLSPSQLSEGTFKTLATLFYLITEKSKLLLLEEPEVCVHHGLLVTTMELIKTFASEKQIIISTHSDLILDGMKPESVYVVRGDPKKGTTVKQISRALSARDFRALKQYLAEAGNLGEYWRHGELEQ